MTSRPRTIQIYLPSGDPQGIRVAELTTSIVSVVEVPQTLLANYLEMDEAEQVGFYFLIGDEDDDDIPTLYVGQSGKTGQRLVEHNKKKEFWNRALVVVLRTDTMTQTHALYLEWLSIKTAIQAARYEVKNGNGGSRPHTPAPLEADCLAIFDTARTLVATLGQPFFEPLAKSKDQVSVEEVFFCKSSNYDATAQYTEEGMVVLAGSKARKDSAPSVIKWKFGKRKESLIAEGVLKLEGDYYVFQKNVLFKSPSGASDLIAGASTNGWMMWKNKDGATLDELKRQ